MHTKIKIGKYKIFDNKLLFGCLWCDFINLKSINLRSKLWIGVERQRSEPVYEVTPA